MSPQQELEMDIAYWVETLGYEAVVEAVRDVCSYWATSPDEAAAEEVPECPPAQWAKQESVLRFALREEHR